MLACTHGSNRAAALNRHPRSSRLRPVSARRRGSRWRSGTVCAVCGFWLPAATRLAVPAYCRIWQGLEQGTPLSGRSIPCSRHHLPFQSAAKARRRLHKFSIRFASQSYQGSSLEGQLQVLLLRAGSRDSAEVERTCPDCWEASRASAALRRRRGPRHTWILFPVYGSSRRIALGERWSRTCKAKLMLCRSGSMRVTVCCGRAKCRR
jgi:hypothetical protein